MIYFGYPTLFAEAERICKRGWGRLRVTGQPTLRLPTGLASAGWPPRCNRWAALGLAGRVAGRVGLRTSGPIPPTEL